MNQSNPQPHAPAPALTPETRLRRKEGVVLRRVAGESMLVPTVTREVDLDSLFLLNPTGVFVWEQMDGLRTVQELSQAVAKAFGVEEAIASADAGSFLASLRERNLVEGITADGH